MHKILALLILSLSIIGLLNAGYITWTESQGLLPPCRPPFACETVLKSAWAHIGPLPLTALGLLFYGTFFILASLYVSEVTEVKLANIRLKTSSLILLGGIIGLLFSVYLMLIMGVVLRAWCLFCLISAFDCILLFLFSSILYAKDRKDLHEN